jgi:DNA invertase Pin-like site-specific DNA recombinase
MTLYGYARVSTDGQTLDAQVTALKAAGAERVFSEKQSGADRAALAKALAVLNAGDVPVVRRLDRLARSTRDLLNVLATVSERGAGFRALGDPWADTTTPHGRLMLTALGGLAEFERSLILTRTGEGRARGEVREEAQLRRLRREGKRGRPLATSADHSTSATAPFRGCDSFISHRKDAELRGESEVPERLLRFARVLTCFEILRLA